MKEIYLINQGDSIDKIKYEYGINENLVLSNNRIFGYKYVEIKSGNDEIILVKNYLPYYTYKVQKNESILDILARGYKLDNVDTIKNGDTLILSRPKSIRYVVKPLEKIEDIANKFGIDVDYIKHTNDLKSNKLFVGQILWI